jgi:diketogulonate reductase-like aldo/keto reductase
MIAYTEKPQENKSPSLTNAKPQGETDTLEVLDQRPEAITQRKMQVMADNSPRVRPLMAYREMVNNGPQRGQLAAYSAIANTPRTHTPSHPVNGGLPTQLQSGVESLSGIAMHDVRVHYNSSKPAQLQAHAFALGSDIHLAPGQEKHLPHEAWHVVQQKQGRVKPTLQLKGVAINDDSALEREADVMGARAMGGGAESKARMAAPQTTMPFLQRMVIQRHLIDVAVTGITHLVMMTADGSLYNPNYLDNEGKEVHEGDYVEVESDSLIFSRRGPNQETYAEHDGDKGPLYGWYMVNRLNGVAVDPGTYIRQDTIRDMEAADDLTRPLRSTIYGMDGITIENFQQAYDLGYRDFDAAYSYKQQSIPKILATANLNKGPVRLIYKYHRTEKDEAVKELDFISQIKNVIIHTVMLHEIPDRKLDETIQGLKEVSTRFGAKAGLSNVTEQAVQSEVNLSSLIAKAVSMDMQISTVENRMSPASPDDIVRGVAKQHGISYLAYGVQGPTGDNLGTCSMTATATVEDYPIGKDPVLRHVVVNILHLPETEIRFFLLQWARRKGVSVISVSRSPEGMVHMAQSGYYNELYSFIREFGETDAKVEDEDDPNRFYTPFRRYLALLNLNPNVVNQLLTIVAPGIWRQYYKHILSKDKENCSFVKAVQRVTTDAHLNHLLTLLEYEHVDTVTKLDNAFTLFLSGEMAGHRERAEVQAKEQQAASAKQAASTHQSASSQPQPVAYPAKMTLHQIFALLETRHAGKEVLLVSGGGDSLTKVAELQELGDGGTLFIMVGVDKLATYEQDKDGNWNKVIA